jgi:uncharacterized alkaline shock family protein YloU
LFAFVSPDFGGEGQRVRQTMPSAGIIRRKGESIMINITNESGTIRITDDVFTNLAGDAATSCFGVKGMAGRSKDGGPLQLLRRESMSRGVVVHYNDEDDSISLELHIGVDQGVNMAAVSRSIMKEVRYKLTKNTGVPVKAVDVYIDTIIG